MEKGRRGKRDGDLLVGMRITDNEANSKEEKFLSFKRIFRAFSLLSSRCSFNKAPPYAWLRNAFETRSRVSQRSRARRWEAGGGRRLKCIAVKRISRVRRLALGIRNIRMERSIRREKERERNSRRGSTAFTRNRRRDSRSISSPTFRISTTELPRFAEDDRRGFTDLHGNSIFIGYILRGHVRRASSIIGS